MWAFRNHARLKSQKSWLNPRFWLWMGFALLALTGFIWGGVTLQNPDNFPIARVRIVAPYEHITPKVLQDIVSTFALRGFFGLNVIALKQQLLALPWVYSVSIKREWPDTIVISVIEQKAAAAWNDQALLNQEGGIFRPEKASFPNDLPLLFGADSEAAQVWRNYQDMQMRLNPLHFNITHLQLDTQGFWHATLSDGSEIFINATNSLERLQDFILAYPKIIESHHDSRWRTIDLRYEDGMAVKWE